MDAQLKAEIQAELSILRTNAPALMNKATTEKLYEIFVFVCLARALKNIGAQVHARDKNNRPTNNLIFRLAPGRIYAPATMPGFLLVSYQGKEYEIQNSLQVRGRSHILHELDVCLLDRDEAENCRHNRRNPVSTKIVFLAECKFYGNSLGLSLGREFLGLAKDCSTPRIKTIVSNVASDAVHTLVTAHKQTENFDVSPLQQGNVQMFIQWLSNELRQAL